ncbi:hypothetical protein H1R20_g739, partial [Candolleomyces eurysporus]
MANSSTMYYDHEFSDDEVSQASSEEASDIESEQEFIPSFKPATVSLESQTMEDNMFRSATAAKRDKLDDKGILEAVRKTCETMDREGINLPILLDAKLLAIYFKFRGVSAKGFDTLHAIGLTMSHKWACDVVEALSAEARNEMLAKMETFPWVCSYDNVNIPFRVFSQRLDNQSELGQGTAATVYIKRDAEKLSEFLNQRLKEKQAEGIKKPLTARDIIKIDNECFPRVEEQMKHVVLRMLLDSPEFDLQSYKDKDSDALKAPAPVDKLPTGLDHRTLQYLLGTVNIAEASYDDHDRLLGEWYKQLGFGTLAHQMALAKSKIVTWVGDQLTVDRLRHLFTFRAQDDNSFDRLDFSAFVFRWLHLQMAFANSLHKQYLGTSKGRGLAQAFELLNKKGLFTARTQGPFHHDLDEVLKHVGIAHIREDWLEIAGVSKLEDLRSLSAQELCLLASKLVETYASSDGIDAMDATNQQDEPRRQVVMWNRDVLQYIVLDDAIRNGDVGLMEKLLPTLLFRFLGGGNGKYANEVLELLQGLHREWPAELCTFIRHHCWLVNSTGAPGKWCPIDKAQEMNIKDIKVTYRSEGPNIKWDYLKKLHPAIPTIRIVTEFIEQQFGTLVRGKQHTIPSAEKDIQKLRKSYADSELHKVKKGRKHATAKDKAKDVTLEGNLKLQKRQTLEKWNMGRAFERSVDESWAESDSGSEDGF